MQINRSVSIENFVTFIELRLPYDSNRSIGIIATQEEYQYIKKLIQYKETLKCIYFMSPHFNAGKGKTFDFLYICGNDFSKTKKNIEQNLIPVLSPNNGMLISQYAVNSTANEEYCNGE